MKLRIVRFVTPFVLGLGSAPAFSDALPAISGEAVLTVSGKIAVFNNENTARFDMEMLRDLPSLTYTTSTIWTEGVSTFTGVPLASVLDLLEADGSEVYARAINNYAVSIPVDSITEDAPMIAYEIDGAPMPRRERGPLWIVYPYDDGPEYQSDAVYVRSVWQLDQIEILE